MAEEKVAYIYVSLVIIFWASTAAIGKLLLADMNNFQVLFYTSKFATISLFIIVLLQNKVSIIRSYKIKDYWHFTWMGFIGIYLYYIFFFASLMFAPAQEAFIVNYTWPIWVIIFAIIILKEEFNFKKLIAIILGFIGVYLVATKGDIFSLSITNIKGDLFALAGAISYGLFSVLGKKSNYDKIVSMMFYFATSTILISITTLVFSEIPKISFKELIGVAYFGIFLMALAFTFWFLSLKHGDTAKMSNMIFLTPFLSLVYIYFLIGEQILLSSVFGLIFIIIGILIQSYNKKKQQTL